MYLSLYVRVGGESTPYIQIQLRGTSANSIGKGALAIRRIFSLVDVITKPKFSNCPNIFTIGLFR